MFIFINFTSLYVVHEIAAHPSCARFYVYHVFPSNRENTKSTAMISTLALFNARVMVSYNLLFKMLPVGEVFIGVIVNLPKSFKLSFFHILYLFTGAESRIVGLPLSTKERSIILQW